MIGIVICSRLKSTRLPKKAHLILENKTVISNLVYNLLNLNIPIVVTVPNDDFQEYLNDKSFPRSKSVIITNSEFADCPLARTRQAAKQFGFTTVIRITHDKIFIDNDALLEAIKVFQHEKADYLYPSNLMPGTNFEIISYKSLCEASMKYKNVEYISYAIRTVSTKTINYTHNQEKIDGLSLLLDYEDDFKLFQIIYSSIGPTADLKKVINFFKHNKELVDINKSPLVTIYTCAYNSAEYINKAFNSVVLQSIFDKCEYILIDDYSNDLTLEAIAKASLKSGHKDKISYFRNNRNLGLASSSNIALSKAKGKYIIRIDSDDFFAYETALAEMVEYAEYRNSEILYPNNYFGSLDIVQSGNIHNHVGGALFNKNALNFIKFTDGLRGYEGYDLFLRAKDRLKIHYFKKPAFFYTQRDGSLSKQDPAVRNKIKSEIKARLEVVK